MLEENNTGDGSRNDGRGCYFSWYAASQKASLKRLELMRNACVAIWEKGVPEEQHAQRSFVQDSVVVKRPQGWREVNEAETRQRQAEARSCRGLGVIVKAGNFFLNVMEAIGGF